MRARFLVIGLAAAAILSVAMLLPSAAARAGELEGGIGGCDLASSYRCTWKPTGCDKPLAPNSFVFNRRDYNDAVDEYNFYLRSVVYYKQCLLDEAKADVSKRFPDLVVKSVEDATQDVDREAQMARSNLDIQRPR